jgi:4-diphosphocytidyl-2-C-methyl-D-erythritol kinase
VIMLAPAKLNLYLHVTGKQPDGYHLLESLMIPVDICDVVEVSKSDILELNITGDFALRAGDLQNNIVLKAAQKLAEAAGVENFGAQINLQKNIPVGAGLGGGSSDAAAVLKGLNDLWGLGFSINKLAKIALPLGADVPFCLFGKPAFVRGIGEEIMLAPPLPKMHILLVNPMQPLATAKVFTHKNIDFSPAMPAPAIHRDIGKFVSELKKYHNDLEANATHLMPQIQDILNVISAQKGCLLARMSGSGATCFGIFEDAASVKVAAEVIGVERGDWWVRVGKS